MLILALIIYILLFIINMNQSGETIYSLIENGFILAVFSDHGNYFKMAGYKEVSGNMGAASATYTPFAKRNVMLYIWHGRLCKVFQRRQ